MDTIARTFRGDVMTADPDPRAARAARLREQIDKLTKKKPEKKEEKGASVQTPAPEEGESPREFIHRRMRELDKKASD